MNQQRKLTIELIDQIEANFPTQETWDKASLYFRNDNGLLLLSNRYNIHYQDFAMLVYKAFNIIEFDGLIIDFDTNATHSAFKNLFQTLRQLIKLQAFY